MEEWTYRNCRSEPSCYLGKEVLAWDTCADREPLPHAHEKIMPVCRICSALPGQGENAQETGDVCQSASLSRFEDRELIVPTLNRPGPPAVLEDVPVDMLQIGREGELHSGDVRVYNMQDGGPRLTLDKINSPWPVRGPKTRIWYSVRLRPSHNS